MNCPHCSGCALYPKFRIEALLKVWKLNYCESPNHTACARFQASSRGDVVPLNLLPNGKTLSVSSAPAACGPAASES